MLLEVSQTLSVGFSDPKYFDLLWGCLEKKHFFFLFVILRILLCLSVQLKRNPLVGIEISFYFEIYKGLVGLPRWC